MTEPGRPFRRTPACRVYWSTDEQNVAARRLYDQVAMNQGCVLYQINL